MRGANPARLPFAFGRQLLQTYQAGRRLEERAAPLLSRLHLPKGLQVAAGLRAAADDSLESAVAEGDAEGVLNALQVDVAPEETARQQEEEEDDEVVSVVGGEQAASQRRGVLARRLLSEDGAVQPEALLSALTPRGRRMPV